jgi:hypothetical protein
VASYKEWVSSVGIQKPDKGDEVGKVVIEEWRGRTKWERRVMGDGENLLIYVGDDGY